jgi:hypothetical protein
MAHESGGKKPRENDARAARLKAALRENLRRRRAQARARGEIQPKEPATEPEPGAKR